MSEQFPENLGHRYTLLETLGQGSSGIVYKAYDQQSNRYVALKTVAKDKGEALEHRRRFFRGAQLAAGLKHRHIIPVYDFGEEKSQLYIVTELLQGRDLKQVIQEGAQESLSQKLEWMIQLCDALGFAHEAGIIHRDIKPSNLFIRADGNLVVTDFEIARGESTDITKAGTIIGTPEYFSPEQIMMIRLDPRSDIFSVGLVFYELLTGTHPFRTKAFPSTLHKILNENPMPPRDLNPEISQTLSNLILRTLEKDINRRFESCRQLKAALMDSM